MRDALVFLAVFGSLPFIFKRPAVGVMVYAWLSLMNPHRLTYGPAYDFPFALIVGMVTLLSMMVSKQKKSFPPTPFMVVLVIFALWATFTSFFALEPLLVWREWNRVMKTFGMIVLSVMILRDERDIRQMLWTVTLSLGFFGLKGGVFTVISGGTSHVFGPEDSYITDNNALALAMVTVLPMIWYLYTQATKKYEKLFLGILVGATFIGTAGSYSRGAIVAGAAMLFFLWLKSASKVRTGIVILLLTPLIFLFMPEQWMGRMQSIDNYQTDESALGRVNAWGFAINVAKQNLLGGGFNVFSPHMFTVYAPEPLNHHAAHSIYFQVLGEHGFIGLALYLTLLGCAWMTGRSVIRLARGRPELKWAEGLGAMGQVSLIGYAVGGAFLTMAYYDLIYYIIAILVVLERHLKTLVQPAREPAWRPRAPVSVELPR